MRDARRQFETNVFGPARLIQLVLPKMREQGWGKIVNLSSMGGKLTFPGGGWYHATKYALEALSDALRFEVRGFGIDVIVIEPGLIRTAFAENVVKEMAAVPQSEGPYAEFNAAVRKGTEDAYVTPPLSWLGGGPESVARAIEKAITASRPKARYRVTASAHFLMNQRAILPDRLWDAFVGTQFPKPRGAEKGAGP
jgi:NAD(P)-dependent dehydrogenase (short-subunit alcohol dehydrogenase family)